MNKRTFALLAAVITFTVGVVLARLSLPNLFKTPPPVVIKEVQLNYYRITGPYEFEDLSVFLIHGPDAPGNGIYTPLQDAMDRQIVTVHETNHVNELAIENVSATEDVFVQAGDIVKGGRQDRVLAVDMILPAKSGRVPISAFCVEQSRWSARGGESVDHFTLTEMVANYSLRQVIKDVATQAGVWSEVKSSQEKIGAGVARTVTSEQSPTSLPLALENKAVQETTALYLGKLLPIVHQWNDVIGFAFAVNDELKSADVYASKIMFKQFWPRLLRAAAVEAIATPGIKRAPNALPIELVGASLVNMELGSETLSKVNPRTHSAKRETADGLFFESRDTQYGGAWIHRSYLSRKKE
ncbi:MAG TPA: DUF6569 family protein [Pyrinomonadaceae bacterium]|nr:DUF6569 family protein [Pyrinomonadaceae bacterium]